MTAQTAFRPWLTTERSAGNRSLDVLIVGAGQAGLALGHELRDSGLDVLLVDGRARIGDSWRERYESLSLFTPRRYSALPGLALAGDPDGYPTKDEVADYLERYATSLRLPIRLSLRVDELTERNGGFSARLSNGETIRARSVAIATGAFETQRIPSLPGGFTADVIQIPSTAYRTPTDIGPGVVLVVGDGAAGRQIALELAETHKVLLSVGGARRRVIRDRILGRNTFWWLEHLGLLRSSRRSPIGRRMQSIDVLPRPELALGRLERRGVTIQSRLVAAVGSQAVFDRATSVAVKTVIWATGYRATTAWVRIAEAVDARGEFVHERGVSPADGLFFIGQPWQWSRGSATLTGVSVDAAYIGERIRARGASPSIAVDRLAGRNRRPGTAHRSVRSLTGGPARPPG